MIEDFENILILRVKCRCDTLPW